MEIMSFLQILLERFAAILELLRVLIVKFVPDKFKIEIRSQTTDMSS